MCDDSRAQKQYWIRRMEELRRQMEEDLERQRGAAAPGTAAGSVDPRPLPVAGAVWRLGSIVACAVVALSILLFSAMSPAATFVYVSNATGGLKTAGQYPTGKGSNWVEIVSFD